ncbi:mitochondral 37S ribosomal protein S27 [Coemansia erecta]|nr:mitochondral 37S ribosomal protein S27 [Coemansia sp. RSA 2618]KAJ2830351.1 mitochondral 37S ribosomal protein S27 [Coemansia erecta]
MSSTSSQALRKLKVAKLSAKIFGNSFNPSGARTGNYILRQSFRGEHMASYYLSTEDLAKMNLRKISKELDMQLTDPDEIDRMNVLEKLKLRGKGPPPKGQGKRAALSNKKK